MSQLLPVGKLPADLLARLLAQMPVTDPRVLLGPGVGLDCAVVDTGSQLLVFKSDPITFATDAIGWYAVQINANDIATTGARPRWFLATLLMPEQSTSVAEVEGISQEINVACAAIGVSVIGGHIEITHGLDRPIVAGTMVGEVARERLITPQGARPADDILLSKGVPIEATAILAREFPDRLKAGLSPAELDQARNFLAQPGISILRDVEIATAAGRITAMHDPTEGGLASALWELAEASNLSLIVDPASVPVPALSARVCQIMGLDPLATIASGALLFTADPEDSAAIVAAMVNAGIDCTKIGRVEAGEPGVWRQEEKQHRPWTRPMRDEIARIYESSP